MKDCPSPGEMPLSRSAPSTDFAAALEVTSCCLELTFVVMQSPSLAVTCHLCRCSLTPS